jgi:hypothetical protein
LDNAGSVYPARHSVVNAGSTSTERAVVAELATRNTRQPGPKGTDLFRWDVTVYDKDGMAWFKEQKKRYRYTLTEESIMNPAYLSMRGGRIEVWEIGAEGDYPEEYRYLVPADSHEAFRAFIEDLETDIPLKLGVEMK